MKRSLAILATLVLALGAVGVGYAAWTSSITVHGVVTTGTLNWQFNGFSVFSSGGATITPSYSVDFKTLTITVTNTYPGWTGVVDINEANTGSLPLKFSSFGVAVTTDPAGLGGYYSLGFLTPPAYTTFNYGPYTLNAIQAASPVSYAGFPLYPGPYTIPVGGSQWSRVQLSLDSSITGGQNSQIIFDFTHTATVALP